MKMKTLLIIAAIASLLQFAPAGYAQTPDAREGRRARHEHVLANLTPAERTQLRAAHQKAKADPAVIAAKERAHQSHRELREARRAAMLRADPSIQPILDKIPTRAPRNS